MQGQTCTYDSSSATEIQCSLATELKGSLTPVVIIKQQADTTGKYYERTAKLASGVTYGALGSTPTFDYADVAGQTAISSNTLTTSFGGGLKFTLGLSGTNLQTQLSSNAVSVKVCGTTAMCANSATASKVDCAVPAMKSVYYYDNFISAGAREELLRQEFIPDQQQFVGTPVGNSLYAMDQDLLSTYFGTATGGRCFVGWFARTGYVVRANSIGINFKMSATNKDFYEGSVIQGLNAGADASVDTNWVTLSTYNYTIHNGWNYFYTGNQNTYSGYRWLNTNTSGCTVQEFRVNGVEMYNDNTNNVDCPLEIGLGAETFSIPTGTFKVAYNAASTHTITSYNPQYVSIAAGQTITFTGTFGSISAMGDATVMLDGTACTVTSTSSTSIACTTGDPVAAGNLFKASNTQVIIKDKGSAVLQNADDVPVTCLWSSKDCWNGELPPVSNEMVIIGEGQRIVYDVGYDARTKSFVYAAILVNGGQLLFFDDSNRATETQELNARYIFIQKGKLQVGSETSRHCNKLEIILHGGQYDQEVPIYGNKMIALRDGSLLMHGCEVAVPWTWLWEPALAGDNVVKTKVPVNDWKKGMWVALSSTDFIHEHTDYVQLAADATTYTDSGSVTRGEVTLARGLQYDHYAGVNSYNDGNCAPSNMGGFDCVITTRGEIGLLTRSVVVHGDSSTA